MGINNYINKRIIAFNEKSKEREYWLNKLSGELVRTIFPYDRPPTGRENEVQTITFKVDPLLSAKLIKISNNSDYRLFMVLLAGLTALLNTYSGSKDILVGTTIFKQDTMGEFLNTILVLRNRIHDNTTFKELILEVKQTLSEAEENQAFPIELLPEQLKLTEDESGFPLFDTALLLENIHQREYLREIPVNILFLLLRKEDALVAQLEYNVSLYNQTTAQRLVRHYTLLLEQALKDVTIQISRLDVMEEREKQRFLIDFNRTDAPQPDGQTVLLPFMELTENNPGGIAVKSDQESLSYKELDTFSNRLANYLFKEKQIQPGDRVGVLMDRSIQFVVAVVGILKAGGSFVPIAPALPEERIKYILWDSGVRVVLSQYRFVKTLNRLQWECPQMETYLLMDSRSVYAEEESESALMSEGLWDYVAETATDDITQGGWINSYTGEPFSRKEMDEYGDNVLKKLEPYLHGELRVLEIGCASGLTMFRVAPLVSVYHGIDLSAVTIEKNRKYVRDQGIKNIRLSSLPAHRIHELRDDKYDLIIINSVIQSFHGHNYLRKVIRLAVELLNPSGLLFAGDVMDHDLKDAMIKSLKDFKMENRGNNFTTKTDWSTELFVSRRFFEDLCMEIPEITGVDFSRKIYTVKNELTRYRYDAILTIGEAGKKSGSSQLKHKYQDDMTTLDRYTHDEPLYLAAPENPAYIIYTSGTTAKPKGVMVEHRSLSNYADWAARTYVKDDCGNFPLFTSISFDLTITSIFVPLITGNTVVVYNDDDNKELLIERVIEDNKVHIVKLTPSHMKILREMDLPSLKSRIHSFIAGGEDLDSRLTEDIYKMFAGSIRIYNEYGPTEATVGCMIYCYEGEKVHRKSVAIGYPAANTQIYLLDSFFKPIPAGVTGELYVSGHGTARGYLNRPDITADKFISNPFKPGTSMYRTGDLALRLPDGNLEFAGRIDQQVKIRGHRIELGEIEARLKKYDHSVEKDEWVLNSPAVTDAIVLAREDKNGDKTLCAYVESPKAIDDNNLREFLNFYLPAYMIPSYFIHMEKLPITPNGKIDRKSLPEPEAKAGRIIPPGNETEETLRNIWSDILGVVKEHISIDSNFFHLGGHSLKLIILVSRIFKEYNAKIPLSDIFNSATIEGIASLLNVHKWAHETETAAPPNEVENLEEIVI